MALSPKAIQNGARFLARKYALTVPEVERLATHPKCGDILNDVEAWREKHALASSSGPVRGYLLERMASIT